MEVSMHPAAGYRASVVGPFLLGWQGARDVPMGLLSAVSCAPDSLYLKRIMQTVKICIS